MPATITQLRELSTDATPAKKEELSTELIQVPPTDEIFSFWKRLLSTERARLDVDRRRKIDARLHDGYSVEELKLAVIGCAFSDWHRGNNDRGVRCQDIELICRDAKHVDRFIEIAEREAERRLAAREKEKEDGERKPMSQAIREKIALLLSGFRR